MKTLYKMKQTEIRVNMQQKGKTKIALSGRYRANFRILAWLPDSFRAGGPLCLYSSLQ